MTTTTQPLPIMQAMKDATRELHSQAEHLPIEQALLAGTLPRELYVRFLAQRLHVHAALEEALQALAATDPAVAALVRPELMQVENLLADLAQLGAQPPEPPLPAVTALADEIRRLHQKQPKALLGVWYVFEGSKNGGRHLARSLARAYGLEPGEPGLRYLDPHGSQQRTLWKQVVQGMNRLPLTAEQRQQTIAAAVATFERVCQIDTQLWKSARLE